MKSNEDSKAIGFYFRLNHSTEFDIIKKIRDYKELGYSSQSDLLHTAILQFFNVSKNHKERKDKANAIIAEAKAKIAEKKETEQLHKLRLETEILEKQLSYHNNFNAEPTQQAKTAIRKGAEVYRPANRDRPVGHSEHLGTRKNFHIERFCDSEYCGACKICQNFTTNICTTEREAEGDIELHLESVHNTGLYQR